MQHHEYLKSIFKVQCWSPRFIVCAPSRQIPISGDSESLPAINDSELLSVPDTFDTTSAIADPIPRTVDDVADLPVNAQESLIESSVVSSLGQADAEPVTFNLVFFIAENIILIDGNDGAIDPVVKEMKYKLARNIIKALATPSDVQIQEISWPLFDHQYAPKDATTACDYVQSKLTALVQDDSKLLICGKTAEQYCIGKNHRPGDSVEEDSRFYLVTFSLNQILNSPKIKHEFYQHLLPLFDHGN